MKVATLAGLGNKVAYEARDRGVLHPDVLSPSDALPLLTFDALRRVSWPRENYARNTPTRFRLWESLAIEQSRIELETVDRRTGLYVHPAGAELAVLPSHHVVTSLQLVESDTPHLYLPLGQWAQQILEALENFEVGLQVTAPDTGDGAA
ncbi:hypothetical protein I5Q34_34240 [Streptomyces sp. AV19]|uniref:hypothetical protein n=1 Tax=Streptomyces sp. AV19 TaxID=2793068 RepID=UPI0018FE968F|nr:hypothetical protein [Streptomyces sp. AV19]MBH1939261.1 hypothetical protein [Streptomyces sp. AV19]MDG4536959.1 hypothetical protein [Streptomyces sp. AV19]